MAEWERQQVLKHKGKKEGYDAHAVMARLCATIGWCTPEKAASLTVAQSMAILGAVPPSR